MEPMHTWHHAIDQVKDRMQEVAVMDLAARSGIPATQLIAYLEGEPIIDRGHRERMARALGWPPEAFDNLLAGEFATDQPIAD